MTRRIAAAALAGMLAVIAAPTAPAAGGGQSDPVGVRWYFTNRLAGGPAEYHADIGTFDADQLLVGDWNGDGDDDVAVRTGQVFELYDTTGASMGRLSYGRPGDQVLVGDWDGNGTDNLAVRRGSIMHFNLTGRSGPADFSSSYGRPDDEVFAGDFDGDGADSLAVRRGNRILIRNSLSPGPGQVEVAYGIPGDELMVGDWNGDGVDTFLVRRANVFLYQHRPGSGVATGAFAYGRDDDPAAVGDWNGDGVDTPVVRRPGPPDLAPRPVPGSRIVAHYGSSATPLLGVLGEGTPQQSAQRVLARAAAWTGVGLPTIPAAEFIATIANASPGPWGDYSVRVPPADIRPYIEAFRAVGGITVLDLQPGRTDFLTQAKEYEELLLEPDVHLALDPEWRMGPGQVPARVIGSVDAAEINAVTAWLEQLVVANGLPPKLVVVHQFTPFMVTNRHRLLQREHLSIIIHLDGFGSPAAKISKVDLLRPDPPFLLGFKLFIDEDTRLMAPSEVITALNPDPIYVSYQ